jgi:hypothetical protein
MNTKYTLKIHIKRTNGHNIMPISAYFSPGKPKVSGAFLVRTRRSASQRVQTFDFICSVLEKRKRLWCLWKFRFWTPRGEPSTRGQYGHYYYHTTD